MAEVEEVKRVDESFYKYEGELYPSYLHKGNAVSFISDKAKEYCKGKGIDIGADEWPFDDAEPIRDEQNLNAYKLDAFDDSSLDYVFSSHCLEHLEDWERALRLWIDKIKVGGILFLYLPHKSMKIWLPGAPWVGTGHKWIPTFEVISDFLQKNGMEVLEYEPFRDAYWSFHIIARKI